MQIVLIGKNGQVATKLNSELKKRSINFLNIGRDQLDLENSDMIRSFLTSLNFSANQKNIIINAAAYTNVEKAEEDSERAYLVNFEANKIIADFAQRNNFLYVNYSTDYVFNGLKNQEYTEEDITDPINKYGKSKLLGENAIREISDNYLILRTSWVFSEIGTNFVKKIFSLLKSQKEIKVIDDQIGCPTSAKFIAETTLELLTKLENNKNITEIINICQPDAVSWFDFASSIRDYIQSETIVIPVSSDEFKTKAVRPKNSVLSTKKLQTILEESNIESWRVNLKDVLRFLENENKN